MTDLPTPIPWDYLTKVSANEFEFSVQDLVQNKRLMGFRDGNGFIIRGKTGKEIRFKHFRDGCYTNEDYPNLKIRLKQ